MVAASSLSLFVINLIGMGIGPTAIALMTDQLFRDGNKVGMSILVVSTAAR
jgi:hypothetical protein